MFKMDKDRTEIYRRTALGDWGVTNHKEAPGDVYGTFVSLVDLGEETLAKVRDEIYAHYVSTTIYNLAQEAGQEIAGVRFYAKEWTPDEAELYAGERGIRNTYGVKVYTRGPKSDKINKVRLREGERAWRMDAHTLKPSRER